MAIPTVTVVMPLYNGATMVGRAIESVLSQDGCDLELVAIDDGSSDGSGDVAAGYGVRVIRQENRGQGAARNRGIQEGHPDTPYVALIDQDDAWLPGKLAAQIDALAEDPDIGLCHTRTAYVYEREEHPAFLSEVVLDPAAPAVDHVFPSDLVAVSSVVFRKSVFDAVGPFLERRHVDGVSDWDLWLRMAPRCRFRAVRDALTEYRVHNDGMSRNRIYMLRGEIAVLEERLPLVLPDILASLPLGRRQAFVRSVRHRTADTHSVLGKELARQGSLRESVVSHLAAVRGWPTAVKFYPRLFRCGVERLVARGRDR